MNSEKCTGIGAHELPLLMRIHLAGAGAFGELRLVYTQPQGAVSFGGVAHVWESIYQG